MIQPSYAITKLERIAAGRTYLPIIHLVGDRSDKCAILHRLLNIKLIPDELWKYGFHINVTHFDDESNDYFHYTSPWYARTQRSNNIFTNVDDLHKDLLQIEKERERLHGDRLNNYTIIWLYSRDIQSQTVVYYPPFHCLDNPVNMKNADYEKILRRTIYNNYLRRCELWNGSIIMAVHDKSIHDKSPTLRFINDVDPTGNHTINIMFDDWDYIALYPDSLKKLMSIIANEKYSTKHGWFLVGRSLSGWHVRERGCDAIDAEQLTKHDVLAPYTSHLGFRNVMQKLYEIEISITARIMKKFYQEQLDEVVKSTKMMDIPQYKKPDNIDLDSNTE